MWLWGSPCQRPCFSAPSRQDDAHVHHTTALVLYAKASYVCMYVCMCGQCFNVVAYKIQKLQKLGHILFVLERYLPSSLLSVSSYLYPHIHFILVQFFSGPKFPLNYHLFFFVFVFVFPYLMLWFLPPGERLLPQHLGQQSKRLSTSTWASFQPNSLIPDTTI